MKYDNLYKLFVYKYLAAKSAKEREKRQSQSTQGEKATNSFTISGKDAGAGSREPVYY